jgi:hypothetical protein
MGLTFLAEVAYDRATQIVTDSELSTKSSQAWLFVKYDFMRNFFLLG